MTEEPGGGTMSPVPALHRSTLSPFQAAALALLMLFPFGCGRSPVYLLEDDGIVGVTGPTEPPPPIEPLDLVVEWEWEGPPNADRSTITPLVANLTDDDGDGDVDLCDIPDVVVLVTVSDGTSASGEFWVLDGASGSELAVSEDNDLAGSVPFALGDLDGDGVPEIIVSSYANAVDRIGRLRAYGADGTWRWSSTVDAFQQGMAISLADLDNDQDPEIIAGLYVFDHRGGLLWRADEQFSSYDTSTSFAADLDDDGDLEVIIGRSAYHADGTVYFQHRDIEPGFPHVADVDADGQPEVIVVNREGISVIEHDGTLSRVNHRPLLYPIDEPGFGPWMRPAAFADFDGDGDVELIMSTTNELVRYDDEFNLFWSAQIRDESGRSPATAFDFFGDGRMEAVFADEYEMFVFDDFARVVLSTTRPSPTQLEYPVVADVDNDSQAEIVVVSSPSDTDMTPTVRVLGDAQGRWSNARRIWNQHAYSVTNVREDGSIPSVVDPPWTNGGGFRVQQRLNGPHSPNCRP